MPTAMCVVVSPSSGNYEKFGHSFLLFKTLGFYCSDAAHRVHPLAGMGLNLGFGDAKALTETLAKATYNGCKLDDLNHLYDYEQKQLKKNVPIMLGIHGLQRLYSTDIAPVILARSIGLQITQTVTPLKVNTIRMCIVVRNNYTIHYYYVLSKLS